MGQRTRVVFINGVCIWGGLMFVLSSIQLFRDTTNPSLRIKLVIHAAICGLTGYLFGILLWRNLEKRRRR